MGAGDAPDGDAASPHPCPPPAGEGETHSRAQLLLLSCAGLPTCTLTSSPLILACTA
jgi:hypothetical protein